MRQVNQSLGSSRLRTPSSWITVPTLTTGSLHERWGRSLRSRGPSPETEHGKILALGRTAKTMAGDQGKKAADERGQAGTQEDDPASYFP